MKPKTEKFHSPGRGECAFVFDEKRKLFTRRCRKDDRRKENKPQWIVAVWLPGENLAPILEAKGSFDSRDEAAQCAEFVMRSHMSVTAVCTYHHYDDPNFPKTRNKTRVLMTADDVPNTTTINGKPVDEGGESVEVSHLIVMPLQNRRAFFRDNSYLHDQSILHRTSEQMADWAVIKAGDKPPTTDGKEEDNLNSQKWWERRTSARRSTEKTE